MISCKTDAVVEYSKPSACAATIASCSSVTFVVSVSKQRKIEINKIKNDIGAFIYNANEAKENYLIDGINNLEDTVSKIAKENKFDNYKIYKNSKDRSSFFNRYLLSLFNNSNLNQNVLHKNKICNNFKNNIVSISPNFLFSC